MRQLLTQEEADQRVATELKELRLRASVTLEAVAAVFGEKKAVAHKRENVVNRIGLWKYLAVIDYFRDVAPEHPALSLVAAIGNKKLHVLTKQDGRNTLRLLDYLEAIDLTRAQSPGHPALPLADRLLYNTPYS